MCVYGNKITPVYIFDNGTPKKFGSLTVSGKPLNFKSSRFMSHSINDFQRDSFVQE